MTTTRGIGGGAGGGAHRAGSRGFGEAPQRVEVRDLPAEAQRAHELLKALGEEDRAARHKVLAAAGVAEPLTQGGLSAVAELYARLDMPLTPQGIARFKAERGLVGGSSIAGPVALAYARALDGGEVLFRIDRAEEAALRPADKACLQFLRAWAKTRGAEAMGRLKEALDLGNPPLSDDAAALANEYVGINTIREVSRETSTRNLPLTDAGLRELVAQREREKEAAASRPGRTDAAGTTRPAGTRGPAATVPTTPPRMPAATAPPPPRMPAAMATTPPPRAPGPSGKR